MSYFSCTTYSSISTLSTLPCRTLAMATSCCMHSASGQHPMGRASNLCNPSGVFRRFKTLRNSEQRQLHSTLNPNNHSAARNRSHHEGSGTKHGRTSLQRTPLSTTREVGNHSREYRAWNQPYERPVHRSKRMAEVPDNKTRFNQRERAPWQVQKSALSSKFGSAGWSPRKRLSPDTLEGIRNIHAQYPDKYTTPVLAEQFKVSPEAIRRILKSKWRPNDEEEDNRRERWNKRGMNIWGQLSELGIKPPRKWRSQGVGSFREMQPAADEQSEFSKRATHQVPSEIEPSSGSQFSLPAARRAVDQVPLADRIL